MHFDSLAVIGAGTMGRGIAEVASVRGLNVRLIETNPGQRDAALVHIRKSVEKGIARKKIAAPDAASILARLTVSDDPASAAGEQIVIEAVSENEHIKREVLATLDRACPEETILASNTSSISITRLAAATKRADKVVGMHFFNPVPVMTCVEVVKGLATSDATVAATRALADQLGKQPFVVVDSPGFVTNRVLMPLINEAVFALQEGLADAATIDELMKQGCHHPMGPLQLADLIGLDVCLSILRVLFAELGDQKFRPCPLLARMVDAGRLGRKSGEGFYEYPI